MAAEMETSFIAKRELSEILAEFGLEKDDMIDVRTCNADLEKEDVLENKQREARYLSISEASCHGHQVTRIEWNFRTIFLLVFLIIVFLIIMFNIYIYLIFP